jgi:Family of unknown function (DUF5343)
VAVTADKPAPYAPASAIIDLVERYRARGLPTPVTAEVLTRAGISDSLNSRTLYALQVLGLIDDAGQPTPTFEAIRKAPENEYKQRLVEWLNGAYADALKFVDPATADEIAVRDAFRNYTPIGQQPRMVSLFIGLYAAAGVGAERASQPRAARTTSSKVRSTAQRTSPAKLSPGWTKIARTQSNVTPDLPPALAGLMASLPQNGNGWTKEKRDQFVTLFGTALDWCYPILSQEEINAAEAEAA